MSEKSVAVSLSRKQKLQQLNSALQNGLLERDTQTKLALLAALSGEHVLLLGPPGTAKSELAKRLKEAFVEANYFERLLTRFSVPEELFGPLSIKSLEQDQYKRLTSGYLPQASVGFIDEIFKANSAVLNTLLTVLNERKFDNGNMREDVPLISVIAASNELPDGDELNALYDRFMLRSFVGPVSDRNFEELLLLKGEECNPDLNIRLRLEDLHEVQRLSKKVDLPSSVRELMKAFREYLQEKKIYVSDRRWLKIVKLLRVSAFTNEQTEVSLYDAWLLPHCLWEKPEQFEDLNTFYKERIAIDGDFSPSRLTAVLSSWESRLEQDNAKKYHVKDKDQLLYIDESGGFTTEEQTTIQKKDERGRPLFKDYYGNENTRDQGYGIIEFTRSNTPYETKAAYSQAHIDGRVDQITLFKTQIDSFLSKLNHHVQSAKSILVNHLWTDSGLLPEITYSLDLAIEQTRKLQIRADKLIEGFKGLPVEKEVIDADNYQVISEIETEGDQEGELTD